jgi:hypothetical protein
MTNFNVNKWRQRHPDHQRAQKPRRTDNGDNSDLTSPEDMLIFAQRARKEREARLHSGDVKRRKASRDD